MRNVVVLIGVLFACGGKAAGPHQAAGPPPTAIGTSGYPGLDWGASVATIRAIYPTIRANPDGNFALVAPHEGEANVTTFELVAGKLAKISIAFDRTFASMNECATVWKTLRAALDPKLGKSAGENLAAFWESATYVVMLSCDPDDAGNHAGLSMSYAPAPPP